MIDFIDISTIFNAHEFYLWFIDHADLWFVFIFMIIESSFIPFPSELVVPPAAYLATTKGDMNIFAIILVATAGAVVGALINYFISMWVGRPIVYRFADSRIGHACLIDTAKVNKAERYFDEHGATSTFIGRLIPAIRQLISIPAGLARMPIFKFIIFTALGAAVWNAILAVMGWWLGNTVPEKQLEEAIKHYNSYLTYAGIALLVFCILFIAYKAFSHKPAHENK